MLRPLRPLAAAHPTSRVGIRPHGAMRQRLEQHLPVVADPAEFVHDERHKVDGALGGRQLRRVLGPLVLLRRLQRLAR